MKRPVDDRASAEAIVGALLARNPRAGVVVAPGRALEHAVGWAIVPVTPRFLETGEPQHVMLGLGPTIVTRAGDVYHTGSRVPTETLLEDAAVLAGTAGDA